MANLRCLVIQQPWAWAICAGLKDIENRKWTTAYRGPMVVVAGANTSQVKFFQKEAKPVKLSTDHLILGAAIGIVDLIDVQALNGQLEESEWASGPYCWKLANPRCFSNPIPCKGRLKLYKPDDELQSQILAQATTAAPASFDKSIVDAWARIMRWQSPSEQLNAFLDSYFALGDWDNLLRTATRGSKIDPGNLEFLHCRAEALSLLERPNEALPLCNQLISSGPDIADGYHLRARIWDQLEKSTEADADRARVLELDPKFYLAESDSEAAEEHSGTIWGH